MDESFGKECIIVIKGTQLRDAFISGANSISNCRQQVDALNVFPVPDGDTGTNMSMTINAAKRELETLRDDPTVEQVAKKAASALLRGARGNSGVILSLRSVASPKAWKARRRQMQRTLQTHCRWVSPPRTKQL